MVGLCSDISTKRVVVLSTDPWLDRLHGASILSLFKALTGLKYRVKVLLPSASNKIIENEFLSVIGLKVKKYAPLFTLISLYKRNLRFVLKEKPSALIFDFPMLPLFLLTRILYKSKGIMLILSRPVGEKGFLGWLHFLHFRLSLMLGRLFVNAITAISPFEASEFSKLGKIPRHKMILVSSPLGEEFEKFNLSEDVNELRIRLGFDMLLGRKVLLYHGVLDEQKGILQLLELFNKSFEKDEEIVFLIVGNGPAKDAVEKFIRQNKANNIVLMPPLPYSKMPELIAACNIGVVFLPDSHWWKYQCPTKLLEFLAVGKPVIASNLPGVKWIGANSPLVTYVDCWSPNSFREGLSKLITNLQQIELQTTDARRDIISRFSSEVIALRMEQLINSFQASR